MLLIPIRHGETVWNVEGREMGHLDSPLTFRGVRQVEGLATRLADCGVGALYTSDLGRAMQTAKILGLMLGLSPRVDPDLRERHMGAFQGLTREEVRQRFPNVRAEYERTGFYSTIPGGESARDRLERAGRVFTRIASAHRNKAVVAVTHGGLLMAFFEYVLGLEAGNGWRFRKRNAAYNAFEFEAGKWRLQTWNDVAHLLGVISLDDPAHESEPTLPPV